MYSNFTLDNSDSEVKSSNPPPQVKKKNVGTDECESREGEGDKRKHICSQN